MPKPKTSIKKPRKKNIKIKYNQKIDSPKIDRSQPIQKFLLYFNQKTNKAKAEKLFIESAGSVLYDYQKSDKELEVELEKREKERKNVFDFLKELAKKLKINESIIRPYSNPYNESHFWKHHEAIRIDPTYALALEKSISFILGNQFTKLALKSNLSSPDLVHESFQLIKLRNNFVYFMLKNELELIDKKIGLFTVLQDYIVHLRTYGRFIGLIENDINDNIQKQEIFNEGLPTAIKTINPYFGGDVYVTSKSNKIFAIECKNLPNSKNVILANNLIYGTNRGYNQSPNTDHFGFSDVEPIHANINLNSLIRLVDLKEINNSMWSPIYFIEAQGVDEDEIEKIYDDLSKGNKVITDYPVEIKQLQLNHDGSFLLTEIESNEKTIISSLDVPFGVTGLAHIQTYSGQSTEVNMYNKTSVEKWRLNLKNVFEDQYYNRNLVRIIKRKLEFFKSLSENEKEFLYKKDIKELINEINSINSEDSDRKQLIKKQRLRELFKIKEWVDSWIENKQLLFKTRFNEIEQQIKQQYGQNPELMDKIHNEIFPEILEKESFDLEPLDFKNPDEENEDETNTIIPSMYERTEWVDYAIPSPVSYEFVISELERLLCYSSPIEYPFKFAMTFSTITTINDLENSAKATGLVEAKIIPKEKAQAELGYDDLILKAKMTEQNEKIIENTLGKLNIDIDIGEPNQKSNPLTDTQEQKDQDNPLIADNPSLNKLQDSFNNIKTQSALKSVRINKSGNVT